jgi:hypothetical protein
MVANMMVLETYMVVNFRAREISQNARKLAEYSYILIKKKKKTFVLSIRRNIKVPFM